MTKIVGHRGAKGLELENTIPSFKLAKKLGVDTIELDVQITADKKFVVFHDDRLWRVEGSRKRISELTYTELLTYKLPNGHTIPQLEEVLQFIDDVPVLVDIKINTELPALFKILKKYSKMHITIGSQYPEVIEFAKKHSPKLKAFYHRSYLPFGVVQHAKRQQADGLTMKYFLMNPLIYRAAVKQGIQVQVYSVDNVYVARWLKKIYPGIWLVTNYPDRLLADTSDQ